MLNSNGIRELAYVVQVDAVEPIDGYDRIAYATVNGWHCVVGKDIKAGDLAVYFEIDSLLPSDDQRFAFTEKYGYKVKTQKYCKGTKVSQGLLMPIAEFPELAGKAVGDFVTQELKITYYDPMDRARKIASPTEYNTLFKKLKHHFPFKQMMRTEWGKNFLLTVFGVRKKVAPWPEFVPKTDEERCLSADVKVLTNHGALRIGDIVNKKLAVKILSMNMNGELEWQPIIGYQQINAKGEKLLRITTSLKPYGNRTGITECTSDHQFYDGTQYVEASQLHVGSPVIQLGNGYVDAALPYLYGCLLGDGHAAFENRKSKNNLMQQSISLELTQGIEQFDYLNWKKQLFSVTKHYSITSGFTKKSNIYRVCLPAESTLITALYDDNAIIDRKFHITSEVCRRLTKESIAILYQDDGCLTHCNCKADTWFVRIATNRYSYGEVELLRQAIERLFDIKVSHTIDHDKYESLTIRSEYVVPFLKQITPFIHPSMRYKTLPQISEQYPFVLSEVSFSVISRTYVNYVQAIESIDYNSPWSTKKVYDITVAQNHNFFANGLLTHNCQNIPWVLKDKSPVEITEKIDGCSSTYAIQRGKHGKHKIWVCSRNCVLTRNKSAYYDTNYWYEMYDKYDIEHFLKDYLERTGAEWVYLQGETYGDGVQKRNYSLKGERDFAAFILCTSLKPRYTYLETANILHEYGIPTVPIISSGTVLPDGVEDVMMCAGGASRIDGLPREGLVFRRVTNTNESFKAVDPEFLLRFH